MSDSSEITDNPWRETVSAIYDEIHLGPDSVFTGERRLARKLIAMIENRHPDFFLAPPIGEAGQRGHRA